MSNIQTVIPVKSQLWLKTADDTDIAARIWYDGTGTSPSYSIHSVVANTLRLTVNAVNYDFLLTNAAYDTMGELKDAVEAAADGHFHLQLVASTRAMNSYATSLKLIAVGLTSLNATSVRQGSNILWDTSNINARRGVIGNEAESADLDGNSIPANSATSDQQLPYTRDPILGNTGIQKQPFQFPFASILLSGTFKGAYGGGEIAHWVITKATQLADGQQFGWNDTAATTGVTSKLSDDVISDVGITNEHERIVVEVNSGAQAMTASSLSLNGQVARFG